MREKAISFGSAKALVGILTRPPVEDKAALRARPGVILLNSGILHRIGASRIHVRIARALAEAGFPVMRFDFSGIGDSDSRRDDLPFEESAPKEVQDAMDRMEALLGCEQFVVFGLCSGADVAFQVGPMDRRIVGLIQLDAVAYRTPRWYLNYYGPRALKLDTWGRFFARKLGSLLPGNAGNKKPELDMETHAMPTYVREFPPKDRFSDTLNVLANRAVKQLYVYTGGMYEQFNYREQFAECFSAINFRDTLQVEYWPDADHIFRGPEQQDRLVGLITEWASKNFEFGETAAETSAAAKVA